MDKYLTPLVVALLALLAMVIMLELTGRLLRKRNRRQRWLRRQHQRRQRLLAARRRTWLRVKLAEWWGERGGHSLRGRVFKKVWQVWLVSLLAHATALAALGLLLRAAPPPPKGTFSAAMEQTPVKPLPFVDDDAPEIDPTGDGDTDGGNDSQTMPNGLTGEALSALIVSEHTTFFTMPVAASPGTGLATGFGRGAGGGFGRGNGRGLKGVKIELGGMKVPTDVAVVCDISGSMDVYLMAITAQIKEQFPGMPLFYAENSRGVLDSKSSRPKKSQWKPHLQSYENLYDAISAAVNESFGINGVYVMTDLQDGDKPADTEALLKLLKSRDLKLYICFPVYLPYESFKPLIAYAYETGGVKKFQHSLPP